MLSLTTLGTTRRERKTSRRTRRHILPPHPPAKKRTRWAWFFRDRKSKQHESRLRLSPPELPSPSRKRKDGTHGCSFGPFGFSPTSATHKHTLLKAVNSRASLKKRGGSRRTGFAEATLRCRVNPTFSRRLNVGSRRGLSLHHVLGLNAIHRITTQISLTTSD